MKSNMTEREFESFLMEAVLETIYCPMNETRVEACSTYDEFGVMTHNKGLVVTMADGSQFQVTIVKSR